MIDDAPDSKPGSTSHGQDVPLATSATLDFEKAHANIQSLAQRLEKPKKRRSVSGDGDDAAPAQASEHDEPPADDMSEQSRGRPGFDALHGSGSSSKASDAAQASEW